jgi:hypothetical protein
VPESLSDLKLDWASHLAKTLSELDGVIQQHFIAASIDKQRRESMDIRKQWGG